jgi:hypothetical protein
MKTKTGDKRKIRILASQCHSPPLRTDGGVAPITLKQKTKLAFGDLPT